MSLNFIHRKANVQNAYQLDKSYYEDLYLDQKKSTRDIAKILNISQPIVRKIMILKGITLRTYKDNPTPIKKGEKMPESQRLAISKALVGRSDYHYNPETGIGWNDTKIETNCGYCGKKILKQQSHIKNYKLHFCGNECHGKWKSVNLIGENHPRYSKIKTNCAECSKEMERRPCEKKNHKNSFCSKECHSIWRSKNQTGASRYNWKGGPIDYYGESWKAARRLARERDNHTCQSCGKHKSELGKNLDVHHKIPFRIFGRDRHLEANHIDNLVSYCNKCHKIIEEASI